MINLPFIFLSHILHFHCQYVLACTKLVLNSRYILMSLLHDLRGDLCRFRTVDIIVWLLQSLHTAEINHEVQNTEDLKKVCNKTKFCLSCCTNWYQFFHINAFLSKLFHVSFCTTEISTNRMYSYNSICIYFTCA